MARRACRGFFSDPGIGADLSPRPQHGVLRAFNFSLDTLPPTQACLSRKQCDRDSYSPAMCLAVPIREHTALDLLSVVDVRLTMLFRLATN